MKNLALLVLCTATVILSASLIAIVSYKSVNEHQTALQPTPTPSPMPTAFVPTLTATPTGSPRPTVTPFPDPAAEGSFGPKGYFRITSPISNNRYDGDNVTLTIRGEAINQPLTMAYSVDGQENVHFATAIKQAHEWDKFFGTIIGQTILPPLHSGSHIITVYGTLANVSAQATLDFVVQ